MMCLRYAFTVSDFRKITERFEIDGTDPKLKPRYNIAPTQNVPVIFNDSGRVLSEARWGLTASWQSQPLFNARAETIDQKPAFRKDFELRRCLMLADSFYEWKHPEKRPFRISLKDAEMFAFAGIYAVEQETRTCCMITTAANELVSQIHDRMPVILPAGQEKYWLEASENEAKEMLKPYPFKKMEMVELTKAINPSKSDSSKLVKLKTSKGTLTEFM
jgi:putative SOS response-associated peptidase YedK